MRCLSSLPAVQPQASTHVAIGVFDGVHRGHQQLIGRMVEAAHAGGEAAVVLTFSPHPAALFGQALPYLTTNKEREHLIADLGVDVLVTLPFTPELARTPAETFVRTLKAGLNMVHIWVGPDFALGADRAGDQETLLQLGDQLGYRLTMVPVLIWEGAAVRSSRIRRALLEGDVAQANGCLGRPYTISGPVVHGRGLGRTMGIPTANVAPAPQKLIPANGVYACTAHTTDGGIHAAVTNVGTRPTFDTGQRTVEAHLLDFDADLYDQPLALRFRARLRDERTFPSLNALVAQIHADIEQARSTLGEVGR